METISLFAECLIGNDIVSVNFAVFTTHKNKCIINLSNFDVVARHGNIISLFKLIRVRVIFLYWNLRTLKADFAA